MLCPRISPLRLGLWLAAVPLAACQNDPRAQTTHTTSGFVTAATAQTQGSPASLSDVPALVQRVDSSVVNITSIKDVKAPSFEFKGSPFDFDPFGGMGPFGRHHGGGGGQTILREQALGSGFIINASGQVITNSHVVQDADKVRVKLFDEREYDAEVKGRDERLDLAVLQLQGAKDLPVATLGSSDAVRVGEFVVAIGNPFGLGNTVTMGIVSAKSREIGAGPYDEFIQTDASINPGNSGGPLFNMAGQVVGINTAINPSGQGIGFAIPSDALKTVLPQLLETGHVERGRLGVQIQEIDGDLAKAFGLDRARGALIGEVETGGPADKAGLKAGDIIVSVDDQAVNHAHDLPRLVARHRPGTHAKLKFLRGKGEHSVDITLDALKEESEHGPKTGPTPGAEGQSSLGVAVKDAPGGGAQVDRVFPGTPAVGELQPGDVIVEVNQSAVANATQVTKALRAVNPGQTILLKVKSDGKVRYVALTRPLKQQSP